MTKMEEVIPHVCVCGKSWTKRFQQCTSWSSSEDRFSVQQEVDDYVRYLTEKRITTPGCMRQNPVAQQAP